MLPLITLGHFLKLNLNVSKQKKKQTKKNRTCNAKKEEDILKVLFSYKRKNEQLGQKRNEEIHKIIFPPRKEGDKKILERLDILYNQPQGVLQGSVK